MAFGCPRGADDHLVALCLPYRSACALVTWSSERFADTPET